MMVRRLRPSNNAFKNIDWYATVNGLLISNNKKKLLVSGNTLHMRIQIPIFKDKMTAPFLRNNEPDKYYATK